MPGFEKFPIQRGARKGDVLSPLLFNAVLEHAIRKWKVKLTNGGLRLGRDTRLTNLRYADDLMIFAASREELVSLAEMLVQELSLIGLQLNGTKTKVLTTSTLQEAATWHTNIWAVNSLAIWILELKWKSCIEYNVHGTNFMSTNWYCWINMRLSDCGSCKFFSDSNVWFRFTAASAKKIAQIGRGTRTDVVVYCWLGSHTWWILGNHDAGNKAKNGACCFLTPIAVV